MEYFYRESLYNLVELAILARAFQDSLVVSTQKPFSSEFVLEGTAAQKDIAFQQTILKMKATEGKGRLVVAIHGSDPVGFYWTQGETQLGLWVHPQHRNQGVEAGLMKWALQEGQVSL